MTVLAKIELSNPIITLSIVVWCIYIGAVLGWAGVLYNKFVPGAVARRLLKRGALSPEAGLTPAELGFNNPLYRFLLRDGSTLRRIVKSAEVPDPVSPADKPAARGGKRVARLPVAGQHFYIPDALKYRAEIRYAVKRSDPVTLIIGAVLLLAAAVILYNFVIPWLMRLLNQAFGG